LRSLSDTRPWRRLAEPALAGAVRGTLPTVLLRGERARRDFSIFGLRLNCPVPRGLGVALAVALLVAATAIGAIRGGQYQAFVAAEGGLGDFLARTLGFGVQAITMTGQSRLTPREVLEIAGVSPHSSMPFFDVDAARQRLEKTPLIKQASVRKLYPGQIVIEMVERTPAGLWQKNGEIKTISADGAVIDELRDANFHDLPLVVGEGANERLPEFRALLDATEELRPKITAGILVDQRRWNLRLNNGVEVKLPEDDPSEAIVTLLKLQRSSRLLDRDILSVDLRTADKAFVRLSAEAAEARAEARPKKGATP
jgi:cell division protein FtsQ